MRSIACLLAVILMGSLGLVGMVQAADVVGRFTQVEGRVDLLKGGQLPATPVKVEDGVSQGDVIRTKSMSKAQLTFIDNTTLTISPESRIAIDEYMFDAAQGKRNAVVKIFQGLALAVVSKIFKVEQPDFVIKTHTAVMGVRGTELGVRIQPNSSTFMDFDGRACVSSIYPEIKGEVCLEKWQGTEVASGLPPTLPFEVTKEDRDLFMRQLTVLMPVSKTVFAPQAPAAGAAAAGAGPPATPIGTAVVENISSPLYVPPVPGYPGTPVVSPVQPSEQTFFFQQTFTGGYQKTSVSPFNVATYTNTDPGYGTRTGLYPANFTASYNIVATSPQVNTFSAYSSGTLTAISDATVHGIPGGVVTGTMTMTANLTGGTAFNFSGPVTLAPNGNLTYQTIGTFTLGNITGKTTGTWTQQNISNPITILKK